MLLIIHIVHIVEGNLIEKVGRGHKLVGDTHVNTATIPARNNEGSTNICTSTQGRNCLQHYLTHTGEKSHKCEVCGKMFLRMGQLKRHNRIHTGERPYSCDVCGMSFNCSSSLKRHHLIHAVQKSRTV